MRLLLLVLLAIATPLRIQAADQEPSFVFMPAYWYGYHWEQTPTGLGKSSERQTILTAAFRLPYGLSLGASWLQNTRYAQDSRITLSGYGPSLGYVGVQYFSAFYTFLYKPKLAYDFVTLNASTSYYGGSGSIVDLGWHFGTSWLRFGPRVLLIDVNYRQSQVASGVDKESAALEGDPWRDRWLEPYIGLWLLL